MTASLSLFIFFHGSVLLSFFKRTMLCRAASRARFWWSAVQTSDGPSEPNGSVPGSPSNIPNRIRTANRLRRCMFISSSQINPLSSAACAWCKTVVPQLRSIPEIFISRISLVWWWLSLSMCYLSSRVQIQSDQISHIHQNPTTESKCQI